MLFVWGMRLLSIYLSVRAFSSFVRALQNGRRSWMLAATRPYVIPPSRATLLRTPAERRVSSVASQGSQCIHTLVNHRVISIESVFSNVHYHSLCERRISHVLPGKEELRRT